MTNDIEMKTNDDMKMKPYGEPIFKCKVGSHLYGLQTEKSDVDYMGIFIPNEDYFFGLKTVESVDFGTGNDEERNKPEDVDEKFYTVKKYIQMLSKNSPNATELLFARPWAIIYAYNDYFILKENYDKIISKGVYKSFTGFAYSQKLKLKTKKERYEDLKTAIKLIEDEFAEYLMLDYVAITEGEAAKINSYIRSYKGIKGNENSFHKGMDLLMIYNKLKEEYEKYGWRVKTKEFERLGYDPKFGYHSIRLLAESKELLTKGRIDFPLQTERQLIVDIREGLVEYEKLLIEYDRIEKECAVLFENTKLRENPDFNFLHNFCIETHRSII